MASERLSSADVASVLAEEPSAPQHVGSLAILQASTAGGAPGLDYDRLVQLLEERISLVPRYRQKIRTIPGHIANPVWVDDPNFDITYHVRRSALPRPGGDAELLEFCARIQSRQLDRARPLWELYLIEGLSDDRVAIITKTHQAMIDDDGAVDIAHVLLDASPHPHRTVEALWMPEPEPSGKDLFVGAVAGLVRRPTALVDTVRLGAQDVRVTARRAGSLVAGVASAAAAVWRRVPESPLSARLSEQRRIAVARTRLDDYRLVRRAHDVTVNDVVLATIAGAIRSWLLHRGDDVQPLQTLRAFVPVSVADPEAPSPPRVSGLLVDLPVGEADPQRRLRLTSQATAAHRSSGRAVHAQVLVSLGGFAPPTLHALGSRAASGLARRMFQLVVTNVPGPQQPLYAAGARLLEMFPILPLTPGHAVSIGLTSYAGGVYYGVNGDRDAIPDLAALAAHIEDAIDELVEVSSPDGRPPEPVSLTTARPAAPGDRAEPSGDPA